MREPCNLPYEECHSSTAASLFHGLCAPCFGKLQGRGSGLAPSPGAAISSVTSSTVGSLSVFCHRLRRLFLVDSGADVSVYPASDRERQCPSGSLLTAANGTNIQTFGSKEILLCFLGLQVKHSFILADVKRPILGADFFLAQTLLIDIPRRCLTGSTGVSVKARPASVISDLCGLSQGNSLVALDSVYTPSRK